MTAIDAELDASGLNCPLPILKAKKALASLRSGQVLRGRVRQKGGGRPRTEKKRPKS